MKKWFLFLLVTAILFLKETDLFNFTKNINFIYYIRPLLWLGVAGLVYLFPRVRPIARWSLRRYIAQLALGAGIVYFLFQMTAGMVQGFGRSPYAFTPVAILLNLYYVVSFSLGVEAVRAYLINSYKGKKVLFFVGLLSIFFVFTEVSIKGFFNIRSGFEALKYIGGTLCPALAESILTSYFAFLGGFVPAFIYHGVLLAFEWFCPILPNLNWLMKAFLGCFIPIFSLLFVQHLYLLKTRQLKRIISGGEQIFGWLVTSIFSVLIIWFAVGVFPLYPSVIVTGSMEPLIKPGDIVLVKKTPGEETHIGDVIQYLHLEEEIIITHRIIDIDESEGKKLLTKGDNNPSVDSDLVMLEQVKGKVIATIPKLGWLTLLLKSRGDLPANYEV
ncbi:MAG: signal peptidase I [Clostridia bacterium]|nr:signal peptidase I [Clostridia bacterium]